MALISNILENLSPEQQQKLLSLPAEAANATVEGIVISDAQQPDNPTIYVNDGFVQLTGYSRNEVLGRNCRFLQGADNHSPAAKELRNAIREGRDCKIDILNYRKDGERFWNRLSLTPIRDVIEDTNNRIVNKMPPGSFVSMFYMIYNEITRELVYTEAGHPPALLVRPGEKKATPLSTHGSLVGIFSGDMVTYGRNKVTLQPGDKVFMYTDAIIETIGHKHEGRENALFTSFVSKKRRAPIDELLESVYDFSLNSGGVAHFNDDATLLGFEVL